MRIADKKREQMKVRVIAEDNITARSSTPEETVTKDNDENTGGANKIDGFTN